MAGFLAAEQMVNTQGADVRDSRVAAAIDSAQNQQEMYNSIRQKVAKGNSCFNGFWTPLKGRESKEGSDILSTGMEKKKTHSSFHWISGPILLKTDVWQSQKHDQESCRCVPAVCVSDINKASVCGKSVICVTSRLPFLLLIGWEQNNMALPWGVQKKDLLYAYE